MQVGIYQKMVEDKKQHKKSFAVLIDPDKVNEKKLDELALEAEKITGKKNLAPSNYPKYLNEKWDEIYLEKEWIENYPFSVENVKEFADFCKDSGGFTIY